MLPGPLEVLADGLDELVVVGLVAVAVDLHMGVDVDGRDRIEIDSVFVLFAGHCGPRPVYAGA